MSNREKALAMVRELPENKLILVIAYMQGIEDSSELDEIPNAETLAALEETDKALKNGTLERFSGSTDDFFADLLED